MTFIKNKVFGRINSNRNADEKRSRKPYNTSFRQQRLKAWYPILSPQSVLPLLLLIAGIFAPIGIGLLLSAANVQDLVIDYTECDALTVSSNFEQISPEYTSYHFKKGVFNKPMWRLTQTGEAEYKCQIQFEVPNDVSSPIYIYYKLTNYYQNHREYVDSIDIDQLKGKAKSSDDLLEECDPLREIDGKAVYPCGLIANSMFNDTFRNELIGVGGTTIFRLTNKETAWSTDRHRYKKTSYNASDIVPPPNWVKMFPNGYTEDNIPDLQSWEEFQIWMRPAALPSFYKLALKNETSTLRKGQYLMEIGLNYPVKSFQGTKSFVLTTNSIMGARNIFLGILYLILAGIAIIFSLIFFIKIIIKPKVAGDHECLNYNSKISHINSSTEHNDASVRKIL